MSTMTIEAAAFFRQFAHVAALPPYVPPEVAVPGRIRCLSCRKTFRSRDCKRLRRCEPCKRSVLVGYGRERHLLFD